MILDATTLFSENQAVTATAISENVIKLNAAGIVPLSSSAIDRNPGPGNEIPLLIQVTEDFAGLTSLRIELETSDSENMSSADTIHSTVEIPVATLKAGYRTPIRIMPDFVLKDYVGMRYTVTGGPATAGKITAALATEVDAG